MAKYKFTAATADGATIKGVEIALTPNMARRALLDRNLSPINVVEKKNLLKLELTKEKVPRKELMHFSRQMSVFMKAGIPVLDALDVMTEEMGNKVFERVLAEMGDSLRVGRDVRGGVRRAPRGVPAVLPRHSCLGRADWQPGRRARPALRLHRPRPRCATQGHVGAHVPGDRAHHGGRRHRRDHRIRPSPFQDVLLVARMQSFRFRRGCS